MAAIEFGRRKHKESLDLFQKALDVVFNNIGAANVFAAKMYTHLEQVKSKLQSLPEALEYYRKAIETYELVDGPNSRGITFALNYEGLILQAQNEHDRTKTVLMRAVEVMKALEDDKLEVKSDKDRWKLGVLHANILSNLTQVLIELEDLEAAKHN